MQATYMTWPDVEIFPAFEYGKEPHVTTVSQGIHTSAVANSKVATFHSKDVQLQLDVALDKSEDDKTFPIISFQRRAKPAMLSEGLVARIKIHQGQAISFVLRNDIPNHVTENVTVSVLDTQQHDTQSFWYNFISQSKYKGRWREAISRSLMILKMLTYGNISGNFERGLSLTSSQNLRVPLWLPQLSQSQNTSPEVETGTIATRGSETLVSPFISSFALALKRKRSPT